MARDDGKLQAWDPNGSLMGPLWTSTDDFISSFNYGRAFTSVHFADFDGDGIPEIYTSDRIFDSSTGKLLVSKTGGNRGEVDITSRGGINYFSHAADVLGEGKLQLILANEVYRVNIVSKTNPSLNSMGLASTISPSALPGLQKLDGVSMAVDINQDGLLDVLVASSGENTDRKVGLYAWDPRTQSVIAETVFFDESYQMPGLSQAGIPFVGDVDGDGKLEVLMVNTDVIHGFRIAGNKFELVYNMVVNDPSGTTGITLFDFNQDGTAELVYRDEDNLRIMRANPTLQNFTTLKSYPCGSATVWEFPVVADVDNDGAAEIVVVGEGHRAMEGSLRIYKSGDASKPWAPARKVWNQYAYNVINVNEDLTIPKKQYNSATFFSGGDCNSPTPNQPFNSFLQQATTLNQHGCPFWLLPDIVFDGPVTYTLHPDGDSLVVQLTLKNQGDAAVLAPLYISVYKNTITVLNRIYTYSYPKPIHKGSGATITFTIHNISSFRPFHSLIVKFNDNGNTLNFQQECDHSKNNDTIDIKMANSCTNDYATTQINKPVTVNVLLNDGFPGCTRTNVALSETFVSAQKAKHGAVSFNASKDLVYTPDAGWFGIDSVLYVLTDCGGYQDSAKVYIITFKPDSSYISCPSLSVTLNLEMIPGVQYDWYNTQTGGTIVPDGGNANSLTVIKDLSDQQSWWVEAQYGTISFPRYRIDLNLNTNCNLEMLLLLPNAFTPNGDGNNDVFLIICDSDLKSWIQNDFLMQIYDKWGGLVFQTKNPDPGWDGTSSGKKCPAGVYTYLIKYHDPLNGNKQKSLRGNVLLLE